MKISRLIKPESVVLVFISLFAVVSALAFMRGGQLPVSAEPHGQQIFNREGCVFCHSIPGYRPLPQPVSLRIDYPRRVMTNWNRNGPDLMLEPGKRTDDWHLAHLLEPQAVLPSCPMPSHAGLSNEEIEALVQFIQAPRRGEGVPQSTPTTEVNEEAALVEVPQTRVSYLAGRDIYRAYCLDCHGVEGNGNGSVGYLLWPEPRDFTDALWMQKQSDAYLMRVIAEGKTGTAMPVYKDLLNAEERALVLYYIKFFINPSARQSLEHGFFTGEINQ